MRATPERIRTLLQDGAIELLGRMPQASNATFVAAVADNELRSLAVYKPRAGETPLWDFEEGTLYRREAAAYEVSEALGWRLVPPTVVRDGPLGIGSLQLFIDAEQDEHFFTLMPGHAGVFRRVAAYDLVVNNADRKGGHCLLEQETARIWVVDHGVCFHVEPKLRTVIWDFAGEPLPTDVTDDLTRLHETLSGTGPLTVRLAELLTPDEVEATRARLEVLLNAGAYPLPDESRRSYPWPPL